MSLRTIPIVAAAVLLTATQAVPQTLAGSKPAKAATAIAGLASSARHCVADKSSNVHHLGWVPENSRITVTMGSDFDPVAAITLVQLGSGAPENLARVSYVANDDGGGNLEPELRITTTFAAEAVLHVRSYGGSGQGCYFFKSEVQTP
jgi:hypothetical protein